MLGYLEHIYRKIPESYGKPLLRNFISFIIHYIPFMTEEISIGGVSFTVYKSPIYDQKHLAEEVSGYNKYYKLKQGDIVVDAGAYSGFFTIYASKKVGKNGKVISFEPDPFNFHLLKRNVALNKLTNVALINKGLYSKDATLSFYVQGIGSSFVIPKGKDVINKAIAVSLDSELKRLGIEKVDFIKMDIEGGEIEAVKGFVQTIEQNPNIHFAIASYHRVNGKETNVFLEKFFPRIGLKVVTEKGEHPTTYSAREFKLS